MELEVGEWVGREGGGQVGGGIRSGEDVKLVAPLGQAEVEGHGVPLHPASLVPARPLLDEDGDFEELCRRVAGEAEVVPRLREGEEVDDGWKMVLVSSLGAVCIALAGVARPEEEGGG